MLKRVTIKLFTFFVLCAALTTVAFTPAASSNSQIFCLDAPIESGCQAYICCHDDGQYCWCVG